MMLDDWVTPAMNTWLKQLGAILLLAQASFSWAVLYTPPMDKAEWLLEQSPFECRMWQPIPVYGSAVFYHRAGEAVEFYLAPNRNPMRRGKALLVAKPPVWDPERSEVNLGYVAVQDSDRPVSLDTTLATRLLKELNHGMMPMFTRRSWYGDDVTINVGLSSVNFRKAYKLYQQCLAQLLPVNFDQIARTRLGFPSAQYILSPEAKERLDLIVEYVKTDTSVNAFFIDGHTDNVGRRLKNLELSKKRAEAVTQYLISRGVSEEKITTRYHGERYPVSTNKTAEGRADNRRVTIRLEKEL